MAALLVMCDEGRSTLPVSKWKKSSSPEFLYIHGGLCHSSLSAFTKSENLIAEFEIIFLQSSIPTSSLSSSESVRLLKIDGTLQR
jgi:hypothetical protein